MYRNQVTLLLALLAGAAQVQAGPRPDWEQALALQPMLAASADPVAVAPPAFALPEVEVAPPDGWHALGGSALDDMRGGFTLGDGLIVGLGIERMVSINGELVASTRFELSELSGLGGDAAEAARSALTQGGLIQNGPGNIAPAALSPEALGATVIQNTLNDQTIRSQTIINASVNSATLMQSLNFSDSVGQAIRDAVRLH